MCTRIYGTAILVKRLHVGTKVTISTILLQLISAACYVFLGRAGSTISCKVTGPRRYSADLPQGGLEIPCSIEFKGEKSMIEKIRSLLTCKESTTCSESTNYSNEELPVYSVAIKSEKTEIVSSIATQPHDKEPVATRIEELLISGSSKNLKSLLS